LLVISCFYISAKNYENWFKVENAISLSLPLSSRAVVDQRTRPQVHARRHGLVTPPRVVVSPTEGGECAANRASLTVLFVVFGIEWFHDVNDWSYCQPPQQDKKFELMLMGRVTA